MQDFRTQLKNIPALRAGSYRNLRLSQLRLFFKGLNRKLHGFFVTADEVISRKWKRALLGLHRGVLFLFLSADHHLVKNNAENLCGKTLGGKWLIPDGMTLREAAGPLLPVFPELFSKNNGDKNRLKSGRIGALALVAVVAVVICATRFFGVAIRVSVNGQYLGTVSDETVFDEAVILTENQARRSLGNMYTLSLIPTYEMAVSRSDELINAEQMSELLFEQLQEVRTLYALSVDGEIIGAVSDRTLVDDYLNERLSSMSTDEPGADIAFAEEVVFESKSVSVKYYMEPSELIAKLSGYKSQAITVTVQKGDTLALIAAKNSTTIERILDLNPGIENKTVNEGDVLTLTDSTSLLNVTVRKLETFEEEIPYETQKIEDASLFVGTTKRKQKGKTGLKTVTAYRTYLNGEEVRREVVSEIILSEAQTEIIRVGTRSRKAVATGEFQWPCSGRISSVFGNRPSLKDYHTGVDISNSLNTPIYAADGGVVVSVKYLNYSYGYHVIIRHDNTGYQTLYAHCASILVQEGDRVWKGQMIAKMGQTGRAYGVHCHFEIIKNGVKVDPQNYL